MRKEDVPQDASILDGCREIRYAVDDSGCYSLESSAGWDPTNTANRQAWELIVRQVEAVRQKVLAGELSPLAFYMEKSQMDVALMAKYAGLSSWRVRRHLKPAVFRRLKPTILERYARVFGIGPAELKEIPESSQGVFRQVFSSKR